MANLVVEFDTENHKILINPEKSGLQIENDLLESTILACRLAICLADMASKTQNAEILNRLSILNNNFNMVLDKIYNRGDE